MTLRDLLNRATPLPWKWWTSCSWRRMFGGENDRPVLMPTNHPIDNHPDIAVTDADMALIENAVNLLPELLAVVECAEKWDQHNRLCVLGRFAHGNMVTCSCGLLEFDTALRAFREKERKL